MLLWSAIFATFVGLAFADIFASDSGFFTLSQDQIVSTDTYASYAAAVKCGPQNLLNWKCGRAYLTCVPFFSPLKEGMGCDERRTSSDAPFPCPVHCLANPHFELYADGGDGAKVQFCAYVHQAMKFLYLVICILMLSAGMVGFDSVMNSIIVAHQGTDKKKL
jgi:hypothetical protein